MRQWSFSLKYSTRPKNARDRSPKVKRSPHINFQKHHRPQQDVNTYSPYWILNQSPFQLTCAAYTDSHRRACYSDCHSTATIKAFISVSTANFLCSCGWPTAWDFQTDDFQPTFSCTTGGKSAQHFWIIQSLCSDSQCASVSADGHTTAIFTFSTSTSTVTSVIFHSSWTVKTSQPVQPAESAQISGLARTSSTKPGPFKAHPNLPKTINKLHIYAQKQKNTLSNAYTSPQYMKKNCVNEWVNVKQILMKFHHKTKKKKT